METDRETREQSILNRFAELEAAISEPSVMARQEHYISLLREHAGLEPVVAFIRQRQKLAQELQDTEALMQESREADPELYKLAEAEHKSTLQALAETDQSLKLALLPQDPLDDRDVVLEIRGGVGGEESALFAADLFNMYRRYAERRGYQLEMVDLNETELGGIKEVICTVSGQGAYSRLKFESGVHRVQRIPVTESGGRIHTSAATVAVMPSVDEVDIQIDPKDLRIDTYRSSGAGGQHVNKTSSAIRITHLPSGLVVTCQDERSQHKNKDKAMAVLRSRLYEMESARQAGAVADERKNLVGSGDRSQRIRTYNFPQGRVTDHRIGLTLYKIEDIMQGDLDLLIDPLIAAEQAQKLAAGETEQPDVRSMEA
ncbi:peptide chain release factor 1 [Oscillospiraceae bacterium HV4-5-C5C]|nr:peptide chain release factor 1 [Oscillospiraceae bacterium HV4-5-C5C]